MFTNKNIVTTEYDFSSFDEERNKSLIHNTKLSIEKLEKQIINLTHRQQEIQNYIAIIDNNIVTLEKKINFEENQQNPNHKVISWYRDKVLQYVELITRLYDSYNRYEETKFRCQKEINEVNFKNIHMIEVSIKQLDEKYNKITDSGFMEMIVNLNKQLNDTEKSNLALPNFTDINEEVSSIEDKEEYSLD